jgi:hypothetical protein
MRARAAREESRSIKLMMIYALISLRFKTSQSESSSTPSHLNSVILVRQETATCQAGEDVTWAAMDSGLGRGITGGGSGYAALLAHAG